MIFQSFIIFLFLVAGCWPSAALSWRVLSTPRYLQYGRSYRLLGTLFFFTLPLTFVSYWPFATTTIWLVLFAIHNAHSRAIYEMKNP
jgi:hypothetical protein